MKKNKIVHVLAVITALSLALSLCAVCFASMGRPFGDMNANGVVDEDDAIYLLQHVLMPDLFPLVPDDGETPEPTVAPPVNYTVYSTKINEYRQALTMGADAFEAKYDGGSDWSSINALMVRLAYDYGGSIYYTVFDIDGNGVAELIFSDSQSIIDIYTVHEGTLIKLFENCIFGERSRIHVLSTGVILAEGSDGAAAASCKLYRIDTATGKLTDPIAAYYYDSDGPNAYMGQYTYVTEDEYCNMLFNWLSDSRFDAFEWSLVAENKKTQNALFGALDCSKAWYAEYWNNGYMLNLYFVFDPNGVCYFAVGEYEIFYRQIGLYTVVGDNTLRITTTSGGNAYESLYRFNPVNNSLTVISDAGLIGTRGESYVLKTDPDIDADRVKSWVTSVDDGYGGWE